MKNLFGRKDLATSRDRRSRKAALQRSRRVLALEPLEGRALLSVSNVNITSITGLGDRDGNLTNEHVQITAATTVSVKFDYTTAGGTGNTNQHAEIWTSGFGSLVSTGVFNNVTDANGPHSGTVTVSTTGLAPGNYGVKVLVTHQGNGTNSDDNSVAIYAHVTPTVPLTAPDATYTGSPYTSASVGPFAGDAYGTTTLTYTGTQNVGGPYGPAGAPTNAGTYTVTASYVSDGQVHGFTQYDNALSSAGFTINKADATIDVSGYSAPYDGYAHGATGSAKGVLGESLAGLDLGASFTNVPGGTAHWTFTDVTGNYKNASGSVAIDISKADAAIDVSGYSAPYDGYAHGATLDHATGVLGEDLSGGISLGASFTNVPGGTAHWTFSGGTNYNDAEGDVAIDISKADATINVSDYTGAFDANYHGLSGTAAGVLTEDLSSLLHLGSTYLHVGTYPVSWSFDGNQNYNADSGSGTVTITLQSVTYTPQGTGYWKNHGSLITAADLTFLNGLNLKNGSGTHVTFSTTAELVTWFNSNASLMAYKLSTQLATMELNVRHGLVTGTALISDAALSPYSGSLTGWTNGYITVNDLMAAANSALLGTNVAFQTALQTAFNNLNGGSGLGS
jgi:hypothetical protein